MLRDERVDEIRQKFFTVLDAEDEDKLGNEDWAMGIARKAHFAQVTLHVRDRVIERVNVNLTLKPGEPWPE